MPGFLSVEDVLELHGLQIERYGGDGFVCPAGVLAIAPPPILSCAG